MTSDSVSVKCAVNQVPRYQEILTDIVFDLLIEPGVSISGQLIADVFSKQCPGPYEIRYQSDDDNRYDALSLMSSIKIEFKSQADKIEWLLKWS